MSSWTQPLWSQEKRFGFSIRMQTNIRRQPLFWQRPDGCIRASGPLHYLGVFRLCPEQVLRKPGRPFFISSFMATLGKFRCRQCLAGRLRGAHTQRSRVASGMTNAVLRRMLVFPALGQQAPHQVGRFIGQSYAGFVFPPPRSEFHCPEIPPVFGRITGDHAAKRRPRTMD